VLTVIILSKLTFCHWRNYCCFRWNQLSFLSLFLSFFFPFPPQQAVLHRIAAGHNITADYSVYVTQF